MLKDLSRAAAFKSDPWFSSCQSQTLFFTKANFLILQYTGSFGSTMVYHQRSFSIIAITSHTRITRNK